MKLNMDYLEGISKEHYINLKQSGMFWVWFPEASGNYELDTKVEMRAYENNPNLRDTTATCEDYNRVTMSHHLHVPPYFFETTDTLSPHHHTINTTEKHSHYFKRWNGKLDPYRVCDLFEVNDAALSHAVKKLLCTGNRGHKDFKKDIEDVVDTLQRKLEMLDEDES